MSPPAKPGGYLKEIKGEAPHLFFAANAKKCSRGTMQKFNTTGKFGHGTLIK
jgi:hypothetical protein